MTERDFFYWLQGFFEISGATELDEVQIQIVKDHMKLVEEERAKRVQEVQDWTSTITGLTTPTTLTAIC